jgi:acyl-CoA synthetase (AMP-forming)/AMP-acid ligase II
VPEKSKAMNLKSLLFSSPIFAVSMNVGVLLRKAEKTYGERIAIGFGSRELSYRDLSARVKALANVFLDLGLNKGDRVAILQHNCPQLVESLYACFEAGFVAVPMNARLHPREVSYIVEHSNSSAIVFGHEFKETITIASGTANPPEKRHLICLSNPSRGMLDYERLILEARDKQSRVEPALEDVAWLFYTSGTTGKPKGAMLTHRNLVAMIISFLADIYHATEDDVALHAAPLTHGSGLYSLPLTARGATNIILDSQTFDIPRLLKSIQEKKVSLLPFLTPTMIKMILISPQSHEYDLSSLKAIVYGGSVMYEEDLDAALALFGPKLVQIYGQAESPMTISYLSKEKHVERQSTAKATRLLSAGLARTDVEVKVVDEENSEAPAYEMGEIVVRGDVVMKGYWNDSKSTAETLKDGWLHTGDIGYLDERDFVYIMDRRKDMVKSGGANIYPREVEEVILQHPAVQEVTVIGVPDPVWGESVKAIVVLNPNKQASEEEIIDFCKDYLASYKKPKSVEFVDSLPKSAYGKVLKRELREKYWAGSTRKV